VKIRLGVQTVTYLKNTKNEHKNYNQTKNGKNMYLGSRNP